MIGVSVTFTFPESFDARALRGIAQHACAQFEGMPGLRSKVFTLNAPQGQAVNIYIWDDEIVARRFFTPALTDHIAQLYGVRPTIAFVEIAALVENA